MCACQGRTRLTLRALIGPLHTRCLHSEPEYIGLHGSTIRSRGAADWGHSRNSNRPTPSSGAHPFLQTEAVDTKKTPGLVFGATSADSVLCVTSAGTRIFGDPLSGAVAPDSVFWICSQSKMIASVRIINLLPNLSLKFPPRVPPCNSSRQGSFNSRRPRLASSPNWLTQSSWNLPASPTSALQRKKSGSSIYLITLVVSSMPQNSSVSGRMTFRQAIPKVMAVKIQWANFTTF